MEEGRSGTEEAVRFETEVESRGRPVGGIVEAAQTLDFEVDQNSAVAGEKATAVVDRAAVAERKAEETQSTTNFEADLQMAFAVAAAGEESLVSRPDRSLLVQVD